MFSFLKMGVRFLLFQSMGTSLGCHDFSNLIDSSLSTTFTNFVRTCRCISLGHMYLFTFRFLKLSQTCTAPTLEASSLSQSLHLPSATQALWLKHFQVKTEAKKPIDYLSLLRVLSYQVSHFLPENTHTFSNLPCITNVPIEDFVVSLDVPGQI